MARPFTQRDYLRLSFITDAGFVGSGKCGFFLRASIDPTLSEVHSLYLFDAATGSTDRIAAELGDVGSPVPAPDGKSLAVLANAADGKRQIALVSLGGGESRFVTDLPQGVTGRPAWSPDGRKIAFTAGPQQGRDRTLPYRVDRATYRADGLGYIDDAILDVYLLDLSDGSLRQVTDDRCMNTAPRWSPDGTRISYMVSFYPDRPWNWLSEIHLLEVGTGESTLLVGEDWGGVMAGTEAVWCVDSDRIVFLGYRASGSIATSKFDLWVVDAAGGEPQCRTLCDAIGGTHVYSDIPFPEHRIRVSGDTAYYNSQSGGDVVIDAVSLSGAQSITRAVRSEGSAHLMDVHSRHGVLHLATTFVDPPELMLGQKRITHLNDATLADIARPLVRQLRISAEDGHSSDAWALTPAVGPGPWPTVLYVHGGPRGAYGSTYLLDAQLLVGAGFAVLINNFRGSGGYGIDFAMKIFGAWGPAGSLDHHATVDAAIAAGISDPDRIGVAGCSHGGFATCWLLGTSSRFRAGVAENPITDLTTLSGTADTAEWIREEFGPTDNNSETYRTQSPLSYAARCEAPLLFIIGEDDMRCPPSQAEQYYSVLKDNGVRTEMLRLPGGAHDASSLGPVPARVAQNQALLEWFTEYL